MQSSRYTTRKCLRSSAFRTRTELANGFLNGFEDPSGSEDREQTRLFRFDHGTFVGQSLIPGLSVKLSAIIPARPTVLSAVGARPPHDGVRRRWWINVAIAVSLLKSSQKSDDLTTAIVLAGTSFPASAGADLHSLRVSLLVRPGELSSIDPHAMHDNRELARDGDLGLAEPISLGQPHAPSL